MKPVIVIIIAFMAVLNSALAQPATNGLILWLDAGDASSIQADASGHVSAWLNKAPGSTNGVGFSGNNDNQTSPAYNAVAPTHLTGPGGVTAVNFDGNGYLDNTNFSALTPVSATIFLLAEADTNAGNYSAFLALRQSSSTNDYQTGLNFDQGPKSSTSMDLLNVEGTKLGGSGGFNFINSSLPFGRFHLFEIDYGDGAVSNNNSITFLLDGAPQISLSGNSNAINLDQIYVGTRAYVSGGVPNANHNLRGQIAALLIYDHQVTPNERAQTEGYLQAYSRPSLMISLLGSQSATVSWSNANNFRLQTATNLATPAWTDFLGPTFTNLNQASAAIAPLLPAQFFRLVSK
jgi:hypothetical protein